MTKRVNPSLKRQAMEMMLDDNLSQYEIHRQTGLSRPYIRKLSREVGYQFPRLGIEIDGELLICDNCDVFFKRPPSKVIRAEKHFCSVVCKSMFFKGKDHPQWKGTKSYNFSDWVVKQSDYKKWREAVLERDGYKCRISGSTEQLEAHHILPKVSEDNTQSIFDIDNGITLSKLVHTRVHQLMKQGCSFDEACVIIKNEQEIKDNKVFADKIE